ncbi:MAG: ankyrin repeat domain-containing protein [Wolbachia sp.]
MVVRNDCEDVVKLPLQYKANVEIKVNIKNREGYIPLHVAAMNDYEGIAKLLLEYGADINAEDSGNFTPLHHAVVKDYKDVVELFLNSGEIDVNAKINESFTLLH